MTRCCNPECARLLDDRTLVCPACHALQWTRALVVIGEVGPLVESSVAMADAVYRERMTQ